jgi:3-oxoacyl-[acyl-carrier protein] reductase
VQTIRAKKALVTGAASGIGRAIALALAREGAELFLVDIDEAGLEAVARQIRETGGNATAAVCDLSRPDQITRIATEASLHGLDILVNSAGIVGPGPGVEPTAEMWNAVMQVNLFAPIQLVRELLPSLAKQKESHVVNVCSVLGLVPARKLMCYQTSKFALVGFSMALRTEVCAQNVGVTALCPGLVDTPMLAQMGPRWLKKSVSLGPLSLVVSADTVAKAAVASIRRNRAISTVSIGGSLIWWIYRISPSLVLFLFRKKSRKATA